jgi:hypothetical protein
MTTPRPVPAPDTRKEPGLDVIILGEEPGSLKLIGLLNTKGPELLDYLSKEVHKVRKDYERGSDLDENLVTNLEGIFSRLDSTYVSKRPELTTDSNILDGYLTFQKIFKETVQSKNSKTLIGYLKYNVEKLDKVSEGLTATQNKIGHLQENLSSSTKNLGATLASTVNHLQMLGKNLDSKGEIMSATAQRLQELGRNLDTYGQTMIQTQQEISGLNKNLASAQREINATRGEIRTTREEIGKGFNAVQTEQRRTTGMLGGLFPNYTREEIAQKSSNFLRGVTATLAGIVSSVALHYANIMGNFRPSALNIPYTDLPQYGLIQIGEIVFGIGMASVAYVGSAASAPKKQRLPAEESTSKDIRDLANSYDFNTPLCKFVGGFGSPHFVLKELEKEVKVRVEKLKVGNGFKYELFDSKDNSKRVTLNPDSAAFRAIVRIYNKKHITIE